MNRPKFIYFDIGGVAVLDFSGTNKFETMMEDLQIPEAVRASFVKIFTHEHELCAGDWDQQYVTELVEQTIGFSLGEDYDIIKDFVSRFDRNQDLMGIVSKLQGAYKIGLLTNMYEHMLEAIFKYELLDKTQWSVIIDSWECAVAKPQKNIYKLAENMCGYGGEEILFIDNKQINLDTAMEMGWQTFLYNPQDVEGSNNKLRNLLLG